MDRLGHGIVVVETGQSADEGKFVLRAAYERVAEGRFGSNASPTEAMARANMFIPKPSK